MSMSWEVVEAFIFSIPSLLDGLGLSTMSKPLKSYWGLICMLRNMVSQPCSASSPRSSDCAQKSALPLLEDALSRRELYLVEVKENTSEMEVGESASSLATVCKL